MATEFPVAELGYSCVLQTLITRTLFELEWKNEKQPLQHREEMPLKAKGQTGNLNRGAGYADTCLTTSVFDSQQDRISC